MKTRIRITLAAIATIGMLLSGCSSDSESTSAGESGGGSSSTHSSGLPITRGEWPFATGERCDDDRAPGCLSIDNDTGVQVSGLAAKDSVFKSSSDVTVKYRGGMLVRQPSSDSANPELRVVVTFYDVTFPRSVPDRDELPALRLGQDSPEAFAWTTSNMGGSSGHQVWPNGEGSPGGLTYQPEPGETLTFAQAQFATGPTVLLGEHDPYISMMSSYAGYGSDSTSAYFAVLDQDPDPKVIDDVRASIDKIVASNPGATGGLASFESRLSPWVKDGDPLISTIAMDQTPTEAIVEEENVEDEYIEGEGYDSFPDTGTSGEQYLPPPPPPPDGSQALEDVGWGGTSEDDFSDQDDPGSEFDQQGYDSSEPELSKHYDLGFIHGVQDYSEGKAKDPYSNDPGLGSNDEYYFGYLDGWAYAEADVLYTP